MWATLKSLLSFLFVFLNFFFSQYLLLITSRPSTRGSRSADQVTIARARRQEITVAQRIGVPSGGIEIRDSHREPLATYASKETLAAPLSSTIEQEADTCACRSPNKAPTPLVPQRLSRILPKLDREILPPLTSRRRQGARHDKQQHKKNQNRKGRTRARKEGLFRDGAAIYINTGTSVILSL